jgi:hypothetical protein
MASAGADTLGQLSQNHTASASACPPPTIESSPHPASSSTLQKDSHVYFHDGNIVFVAGVTCFRVHQSLVAKHSSIFRDMLSIPQPQAQDIYDGVATVDLQDDPDILRALLRVIYEPLYVALVHITATYHQSNTHYAAQAH